MNVLLAAEIKWINKNSDRYEGPMHAKAVIGNIRKRYRIIELEKAIREKIKS